MTNRKSKSAHAMVTLMKIWTKTFHILYVFRNNVVQISYRKKKNDSHRVRRFHHKTVEMQQA